MYNKIKIKNKIKSWHVVVAPALEQCARPK